MNKEERDPLESLEHELYDPRAKIEDTGIHRTRPHRPLDLPTSWGDDTQVISKGKDTTGMSFGMKFLLAATMLLFAALAFTAWRVISLRNVVSAANIDMTADITPYIEGGESTPLIVTLRNRNTAALQEASVTLLYKQGTGSQDEQEKVQEKRDIGTVNQGEYKKQDFVVSLYGAEGETRDLTVKLEYKVAGSNAVFSKVVTTSVVLKTPPISVSIDGPDILSIGQTGTYTFTIKNNSATTSLPSTLQIIFPTSFTKGDQSPDPISRSNSWTIAPLASGDEAKVTVTGSFDGAPGEAGTISAKIGSQGDTTQTIGVVYASQSTDVTLRASPLTLSAAMTTDSSGGENLRYGDRAMLTITYRNTSSQVLEDVSIKLALSGDAAVYTGVDPTSGYYDSVARTITWDKTTFPDLQVLAPNSEGTVIVVIPIVSSGNNSPVLKTSLSGTATSKAADDIIATFNKTWAVQGSASIVAHTQYKNSSIANSGPIPPVANQATTYTANIRVSAQNALSATRVSFNLPTYVTWRNTSSDPTNITYDSRTRTVSWNIGKLDAGKTVLADISLSVKPSQSHVNSSPAITSGIVLDADEDVSRAHIKTTLSPLTTALYNETWPTNPSIVIQGQ